MNHKKFKQNLINSYSLIETQQPNYHWEEMFAQLFSWGFFSFFFLWQRDDSRVLPNFVTLWLDVNLLQKSSIKSTDCSLGCLLLPLGSAVYVMAVAMIDKSYLNGCSSVSLLALCLLRTLINRAGLIWLQFYILSHKWHLSRNSHRAI